MWKPMIRLAFALAVAAGASTCGGRSEGEQADAAWRDAASDVVTANDTTIVTNPDVPVAAKPDVPIIVVRPDPRESGATVAPDGRVIWPKPDGAVETADADSWDAGPSCPPSVPTAGSPCSPTDGCSYPVDCCGFVVGFWRASCILGAWTIRATTNGEVCAPCAPFPREGEVCSLEAACQAGPPPVCLMPSCYGQPHVARCTGGRWAIEIGCIK
jgi:hypothetical protein